jgi:flagellar FliL protein
VTVLLFIVAVIGAECLVTSLCLPVSSATTSAAASSNDHPPKAGHSEAKAAHSEKEKKGKKEKKGGHEKEPPAAEQEEESLAEQVEVDLEQFSVTAHQPTSNTTTRIEFHLFGIVNGVEKAEFEKLLKLNQHRIREQVLVIVRSSEGADLADAGLGLIKRQILEKTNALLGKPLLRAVIVSEFSYMEQ